MRYRTAAILSAVVFCVMFGFPAVVTAVFLPSLEQGLPVPEYEQLLLGAALFCSRFSWLITLPIVSVLLSIPAFTRGREVKAATPSSRGEAIKNQQSKSKIPRIPNLL
jgi:hypothetical protein